MKRKVAKGGGLRLSPNEEALLLKEEHERRRKLRLQQVREQERNIALQIRQDIKQRRDEQLHQLAEELEEEWRKAQDEKIKTLEKLYLSSLRAMGEGHRQAKENEPDLEALAKQAEERKQRAEKRHKEALKEQRNQKEKLQREQTWRVNARKHALDVEKGRAAKIASLPPPPPHPFEIVELKNIPTVKVYEGDHFSLSRHHLFDPYVDKEMDVEQPDARLLAEEEAKRQEKLQNEEERDKREQQEKAHLRGKHALKMVRLARDREKLMQELEQMQNMDLARRRRIVAQMPPQLFEPAYRRMEIKEEWQKELECAFEDMYTGDRKMKGDLILHLDPQPLPTVSSQDDELELSQEPDSVCEVLPELGDKAKDSEPGGSEMEKPLQVHSKVALTKLLNKIRNQKNHWTSRCEAETPSEIGTIESGTLSSRERRLCESEPEHEPNSDPFSEAKDLPETLDQTVVAGNAVLSRPQEQAKETIKEAERQNQMAWLEHQKQQQLALLQQIEEQKLQLEVDFLKEEAKREQEKRTQQSRMLQMNGTCPVRQEVEHQSETAIGPEVASSSREDDHLQMIRDYQQRLLMQNRIHKESVDEARRRLLEYQNKLKQRYPSASAALLNPAKKRAQWNSIPESPLQLQGFDVLQRVNPSSYQPSNNASVQEFTRPVEHSEHPWLLKEPSEQKNEEQMFDVGSGRRVQPTCSQVEHTSSQLSQASCPYQQTEKLGVVEMPVTQSREFHDISGSFMLKSQDTSVTSQPVARTQQVRFILPADNSFESSETLWADKSESPAPLEKNLLPTSFLKQQHLPTETRMRTSDPAGLPNFQPLYSLPTSVDGETGRTQESMAVKNASFPSSNILELRDRMLASSESIQAQQEHLKELQEQLDEQREALLSRQRIQEELLMQKHACLKRQMEQQQEALSDILKRAGQSSTYREITQAQEADSFNLTLSKEARGSSQGEVHFSETSIHVENILYQSVGSADQIAPFQNPWGKEQKWIPSKPPLTKVKLGLDLEQHELSVIPELDTPRSGRLSAADVGELQSSKRLVVSLHEDLDRVRMTLDAKEQSSGESLIGQLSGLWCEKLGMDAGGLREAVHLREPTSMDQDLPSNAADLGRRIATNSDPSLRPNSTVALSAPWSPASLSPPASTQEAACSYLSSFTISTDSFISSDNPGRSFASTGLCSAGEHLGHLGSPTKEKANHTWDSSVSQLSKQDDPSDAPDSSLSFGETLHSNRSKFQQLIDKYTRDLSWSSLSNVSSHDPSVGLDGADTEQNVPNFHHELFQPLEPNLGSDTISPLSQCRILHDAKDLSKSSDLFKSHELATSSSEGRRNSPSFLSMEKLSNTLQTEETREQIQGAEDCFQHLPVESILSELSQSAYEPGNFSIASGQNLEMSESVESDTHISPESIRRRSLERDEANINPHSPIEHFRSPSLSPVEDQGTFYQLLPGYGKMKNALEIRSSVKENLCFVELPVASADRKCEMVTENVTINDDLEIDLSRCTLRTVEEQSFLGTETVLRLPQEMNPEVSVNPGENSIQQNDCVPDTLQQPHLNSTQAKSSDSCASQSSLPVWETQTGQGIMEEPELTLISSSDISTVESDLELFSQGDGKKEKTENLSYRDQSEVKCCPKSGEFLPLNLEVDDAASTKPDNDPSTAQSPKEGSLTQKHKPTEFTSAPGSLQESFLKRKKDFIERSSKRLEKLKRERCTEQPHAKASQQKKMQLYKRKENSPPPENLPPPGLPVDDLKKVEEVKVCSADDRKTAELQMYQRTSRLYNNLSEVKVRKRERERQDTYARNRERAKEFQKKTLEKLRAKKTH